MGSLFHDMSDEEEKMHSPTRELVLKVRNGGAKESSTGLVDPGLFKGTNKLFTEMDDTGLWFFKYERGVLPEPLKQRFTSVSKAVKFATEYLAKRNVDVTEVKDKYEQKSWNSNPELIHRRA
jgi:hypothetical protein